MNGQKGSGGPAKAAVLVAAVTLLAVALPASAHLHAQIYQSNPDAERAGEALAKAEPEWGFTPATPTRYEAATFTVTVVYGKPTTPSPTTVNLGNSNVARLEARDKGAFDIEPTSRSRLFLDQGIPRSDGGYALTWTWEVTPLVDGEQTVVLTIVPTVTVNGRTSIGQGINEPIPVEVDVNPAARDWEEVVSAAADMETQLPDRMTVGEEYDVGASMSMAGHQDSVTADITLAQATSSAEVTISTASAAPRAVTGVALTGSPPGDSLAQRWTVTPDEPGQVDLVFTANVAGRAAEQELERAVQVTDTARAVPPGASFWDLLQGPIVYITPFIALAAMLLGLWTAWSKRHAATAPAEAASSGGLPQDAAPPDEPAP